MTPARWAKLAEIFPEALAREGAERDRFLAEACAGDPGLHEEARRLLAGHDSAGDFLSDPLIELSGREEPPPSFSSGQLVANRFRITRFIARGGMGEVYEARDLSLAADVALKAIQPRIAQQDARELFRQEILSARSVTHVNVCRIHDIIEYGDPPLTLLTMELLDGPTLSQYLKEHGPLAHRQALPLIQQICAGLQAANDAGVIHGDFKASNVILVREAHGLRAVITDFGLARRAGSVTAQRTLGTPGYLAPEQLDGGPATRATDVYALGVVIGKMIGKDARAWRGLVRRCTEQAPERRYQRPADVARALQWFPGLRSRLALGLSAAGLAVAAIWFAASPREASKGVDKSVWAEQVLRYGTVSQDGRYITYTDLRGDLAIHDLRSGTNRLLTHKPGNWAVTRGNAMGGFVSPDDRMVAFQWSDGSNPPTLQVVSIDGAEAPKVLGPWRAFGWTPDSKQILVADLIPGTENRLPNDQNRLALVSPNDGVLHVLKAMKYPPHAARLSPDGRFIAFDAPSSERGFGEAIFTMAADGSGESVLVQGPGNDAYPEWSTDGSQILFVSDRTGSESLWIATVAALTQASPRLIKDVSRGFMILGLTRQGDLFYRYGGLRTNVYQAAWDSQVNVAGAPEPAVNSLVNSNLSGSLSPRGDLLSFLAGNAGSPVLMTRLKNSQNWPVSTDLHPMLDTPTRWYPDGRSILIAAGGQGRDGSQQDGLYKVDLTTGQSELVIRPASEFFDILSGGKSILYEQIDPETKQFGGLITRIEVATGKRTILKRAVLHEHLAEINVSPDGRLVAYVRLNDLTSQSYLEVMPVEGGDSRVVFHTQDWTAYSVTHGIAWTPDQRYLVFAREWKGRSGEFRRALVKVPVEGGEAEEIGIALEGGAHDTFAFPSFSADGRHLDSSHGGL